MQKIIDSVTLQKREIETTLQKRYIQRDLRLVDLDKPIIKAILGPRRAGKSFFAAHEASRLGPFAYLNFDDEILSRVGDNELLIESARQVYGKPLVWVLDEVQNLADWELFVNRLHRRGFNLIVTGSNSKLLGRDLATHLTGRILSSVVFPFSFAEFLRLRGGTTTAERSAALVEYSRSGGFPEPLVNGLEPKPYLVSLFDGVLFKDIILRRRPKYPQALQDLAMILLANIGNPATTLRLARLSTLKSPITAGKYFSYLEEAFLFFAVPAFSWKVGEQVRAPKKIYVIDNGFHTAKAFSPSPNTGRLYENMVAVHLYRQALNGNIGLRHYKNPRGLEVDFVVLRGSRPVQLIQVCGDASDERTNQREIRALLQASVELKCSELLILTENKDGEEDVEWFGRKGRIRYKPLWQWLSEGEWTPTTKSRG